MDYFNYNFNTLMKCVAKVYSKREIFQQSHIKLRTKR